MNRLQAQFIRSSVRISTQSGSLISACSIDCANQPVYRCHIRMGSKGDVAPSIFTTELTKQFVKTCCESVKHSDFAPNLT